MKHFILTLSVFISTISIFSQDVKFKNNELSINDKTVYHYEENKWFNTIDYHIINSETKDRVISYEINRDGSYQVTFYNELITFESKRNYFTKKDFIIDLIKCKVLGLDGVISKKHLDFYVKKNKRNVLKIEDVNIEN